LGNGMDHGFLFSHVCGKMEITIMASLLAKWYMNVNTAHSISGQLTVDN